MQLVNIFSQACESGFAELTFRHILDHQKTQCSLKGWEAEAVEEKGDLLLTCFWEGRRFAAKVVNWEIFSGQCRCFECSSPA